MNKFKNCFTSMSEMYRYEILAPYDLPHFGIKKGDKLADAHIQSAKDKQAIEQKAFDMEIKNGEMIIRPKGSVNLRNATILHSLDSWEFSEKITEEAINDLDQTLAIILHEAIAAKEAEVEAKAKENEKN